MSAFPSNKYNIIYADPPWRYKDKSKSHGGGAEQHYPTMSIDEICALPVSDISARDSILFLWVTMPMLAEGLRVINEWGFIYKTVAFVWVKGNRRININQLSLYSAIDDYMGMGRWTRANAELCLLASKGKPKRQSASVRQIIYSPIQAHSEKPYETRKRIIELMGELPRIELFARENTAGWDVWGNEVEATP